MIKKISVDQLKQGMYIHDLDCGWMHHPFLSNTLKVKSATMIEKIISHGIKEIYIDTDKGLDVVNAQTQEEVMDEIHAEIHSGLELEIEDHINIPLQEEMLKARPIIKETRRTVKEIIDDVKRGRKIAMDKVDTVVENMIGSILRNKDALISLGKIRQTDEYTFTHSVNVCVLMIAFSRHLGFDYGIIKKIAIGGLLHDIGKTKWPAGILHKKDRLTETELLTVREHVKYGCAILKENADIDETSLYVVTQHHERMDGTGYPDGLKGGEISMFGQMSSIVDVYDAITADRGYKNKIAPTEGLRKLYEWSKFHFNRVLVQRFIRCVGIYPVGSLVRLESGLLGIVLNHDEKSLLHPVVKVVYDTKKDRHVSPKDIDLSESATDKVTGYELPEKWNIWPDMYL